MRCRLVLPTVLLLPLGLLAGCGSQAEHADVVASFYPLQFVAQRIVGEHLSVGTLTSPGQEPHDLELTARQRANLSEAKVVLYEKGLQPSVDEGVADADPDQAVDAADIVKLRPAADEHGDEHGGLDPHFWQDPTLMIEVARAFSAAVIEADPDHRADYEANTGRLVSDLTKLDADYRTGLATCATRTLVVSHDAFGYLGSRYRLKIVPIAGITPDAEPSVKRLGELRKVVRDERVTMIFSETLASPKLADTLAQDAGVRTEVLDPLEGLTKASAGEDYLSVMRSNLAKIRQANSCS